MADNDTDSGFNVEYNRPKMGLTGEEPELTRVSDYAPSPTIEQGNSEFYQARPFSDQKGERIAGEFIPFREEHEPYNLQEEDKTVCISKAFLYVIHPLAESVKRYPLTPLQIAVQSECVVYAQFKTDDHGNIKTEEAENEGEEAPSPYVLKVGEGTEVPASTNFTLPDGVGGVGKDGEYNIPICFIQDFKFVKHQFDSDVDGRQAQVMGALEGQRGPMFWIHGYDALKNVGGGQNVYKDYTESDDFKNLRTLTSKGQTENCSGDNRVSGVAQINVATNGDTIEIYGNRKNETIKVGDKFVGIVEDGLVRCFGDLPVETLTLTTVPATTTTSVSVASCPTTTQTITTAWADGQSNSSMIQGTPHNKMWADGTERTLPWVKICVETSTTGYSGASEACYWVVGYEITSSALEATPASVTYVDSPSEVVGVTSAVQITGISDDGSLTQTSSITELTCVDVVTPTGTQQVYTGSYDNLKVVKEPESSQCDYCQDP
tara:strand:- start:973 stop:2445 length:1473 start_codon:yes stop_codon:yes gene_type:complete